MPTMIDSYVTEVELEAANVLNLGSDIRVLPESKLVKDLGAEGVHILELFHRLGIDYRKYIKGGDLNNLERERIRQAAGRFYDTGSSRYEQLMKLAELKGVNFINALTIQDIADFKRHEEEYPLESAA